MTLSPLHKALSPERFETVRILKKLNATSRQLAELKGISTRASSCCANLANVYLSACKDFPVTRKTPTSALTTSSWNWPDDYWAKTGCR
jgi:hypothetical protein